MVEAEEKFVAIIKGGCRLVRAVERHNAAIIAVREHETMHLPYMFLDR
jgi:hypothetical protein